MTRKILTIAALALMMAACSNEDTVQQLAPAAADAKTMPFRAVISADNTPTRGLTTPATDDEPITAKWEVDEKIAIVHGSTVNVMNIRFVDANGNATIEGTINNFIDGETTYLVYLGHHPDAMVDYPDALNNVLENASATAYTPEIIAETIGIRGQDGTLETISDEYDYRLGTSTLIVSNGIATLASGATLSSQFAIWKLKLTSDGTTAIAATQLDITDGADNEILSITPTVAASEFYVLLPALTNATYKFKATAASGTYKVTCTSITLAAANFYHSKLTMVLQPAASKALTAVTASELGWRIGSNGVAYEPKGALPTGVTAVAMIAKVNSGGGSGLALELSGDPGKGTWAVANSYAAGKAAVGGRTWRLPTKQDWIDMLVGYLEATDPSVGGYGDDNIPYTAFKTQYNAVGGDLQYGYYWSSTENGDNNSAWHVYLNGSTATIIVSNKGYVNGRYLALLDF